ncbi:g5889 [Coccomyxa viridis]|uniref:G5889 protein n=1 Tax=Coccomyxa viridis TaxID=1274662 RepID=A0ABP1G0U1_9CHLO
MTSGKAKRQRDEVEVEDLPATKRHATADGSLRGLQQIPQFGAFYPPPQKEGSTPQEKKRKRHFYADGRRAVLPKLPCLLPDNGTAASWEAPELEDSKEADGSSAIASGAPTLMTLQQAERPANAPAALTDKSPLAETGSTKAPQLPPKLPQFNTAGVQPQSQHAGLQQQEGLAQGSQASSMSGVSEAAAKGSFQPQAAPQQVPFGQQLIPGTAASAPSIQQSQIPVLGTPSNATTTEAGGFAGVPAQPTVLPFQPVQPSAVPGQQPGLLFGQLTHQGAGMANGEGAPQPQRAVRRVKRGLRR